MSTAFSKPAFEKLRQDELINFDNYEHEIQSGLQDFIKVGNALLAIQEGRLFRHQYPSFEAYCQSRWGFSQWYAYKLQKSAEVVKRLDSPSKPTSEAQVRPLTGLEPEEQPAAWQEAVDTAPNGKPTAAHVAAVVAKRKKPKPRPEREAVEIDDEPAPAEPNTIGEMFARYDSFVAELTNEQPPHVVLALKEHSAGVWAALG